MRRTRSAGRVWISGVAVVGRWSCHVGVVLALATASFDSPRCSAADDPFDGLRQRIEQLEQDNRELRAERPPRSSDSLISLVAEVPPAPIADVAGADDVESADEARIGSLVEKYLRRRAAEPVADLAQEQCISALQGSVAGIMERLNKKTYPTVVVTGVFQADAGFFHQNDASLKTYDDLLVPGVQPIQNGADFRRARLGAKGSLTETTNYFFQMDFGFFGRPTFTDVWAEQTQIPFLGTVRIGQWKQPFSLEVVSSFRYTTFMERSVLFQPFTPFRHLGIGFYNNAEDLSATWAASVFSTGQDQFGGSIANKGGVGTAERFTWLPYWNEATKGTEYLHLGVGHFFNAPPNNTVTFKTIPELYIGQNAPGVVGTSLQAAPGAFNGTPPFVNTGSLKTVNAYNVLGTELLWVDGPFSLQSEAMVNFVSQTGGPTAVLPGGYAQVGYFLTGEHRPYDRKAGAIDRVIPCHNFRPVCGDCECSGWGAWEVASRISYLNLNSHNINGGSITDYTAGVNWYLNPNWKIVFNYVHSWSNYQAPGQPYYGQSNTDMFAMRTQVDF